jgi:hypothetical protein
MLRSKEMNKILLVVSSPKQITREYQFFSGYFDPGYSGQRIEFSKDITYTTSCPDDKNLDDTIIIQSDIKCNQVNNHSLIIEDQKDSGVIFRIYNGKLCSKVNLTFHKRYHLISNYDLEDMNNFEFCQNSINKYD